MGDGDEVGGVEFGLGEHRNLLAGHFGGEDGGRGGEGEGAELFEFADEAAIGFELELFGGALGGGFLGGELRGIVLKDGGLGLGVTALAPGVGFGFGHGVGVSFGILEGAPEGGGGGGAAGVSFLVHAHFCFSFGNKGSKYASGKQLVGGREWDRTRTSWTGSVGREMWPREGVPDTAKTVLRSEAGLCDASAAFFDSQALQYAWLD